MKNSRLTVFLLVLCFALWGLVNNMSDNLVPAFQRIFTMDQDRAVLVQVAFYGAYAVLALFTSILVEEFSFRTGILIGLAVYVCGAILVHGEDALERRHEVVGHVVDESPQRKAEDKKEYGQL